jgi:hypothetical protein
MVFSDLRKLYAFVDVSALPTFVGGTLEWDINRHVDTPTQDVKLPSHRSLVDPITLSAIVDIPCQVVLAKAQQSGYLLKEGRIVKSFKRRFFVLSNSVLYYYANEKAELQLGAIVLDESCIVNSNVKMQGYPHTFILAFSGRSWVLAAGSAVEKRSWVNVCSDVVSLPTSHSLST